MSDRSESLNVLIVDDSEDFLAVACSWIDTQPSLDLMGTARNGVEAVEAVGRLHPDLVLMDAFMPLLDGFEATRRVKSAPHAPWVVLVSVHEGVAMEHEAWAAGADGFVPKADLATRMPALLRALAHRAARRAAPADSPKAQAADTSSTDAPIETREVESMWSRVRGILRGRFAAAPETVSTTASPREPLGSPVPAARFRSSSD